MENLPDNKTFGVHFSIANYYFVSSLLHNEIE